MTKKRVAVYCRVSTESELQEGSFETQQVYYRDYIRQCPDWELVEVFGDKGKTGRNTNRPGFQAMMQACEEGQVDMILTKSISRFARNVGDCVATVRKLKAMGIAIYFEKEALSTMDMQGELLLSILASLAEEESNSISQNLTWANEHHNAEGKPTFRPSYGYTKKKKDWQWHVNETEARRVRRAFNMVMAGHTYREIINELDTMEAQECTGETWSYRRVKYMLANVNYTGMCLTNKNIAIGRGKLSVNKGQKPQYLIEGHHEPIVSQETFDTVQRLMQSRTHAVIAGGEEYTNGRAIQ